jgi:hypothetical protein
MMRDISRCLTRARPNLTPTGAKSVNLRFSEGFFIGKYLSRLRQFDQVIALQERFEAQLQAPRLAITFGMRALGMTG